MWIYWLTFTVVSHYLVKAQSPRVDFNRCLTKSNCGECIGISGSCAWCSKEGYPSDRCDMLRNHVLNGCELEDLVNPDNEVDPLQDENVRDARADEPSDSAVQLRPQRIAVKLRPNKPVNFTLTFRLAENYPVDLYFLMDLTRTMEDDKANTASLAATLAKEMYDLTNNVRFGFGSFVDKVTLPFTSTHPEMIKKPCKGCVAPYSFTHWQSFTNNISLFTRIVRDAEISGNIDTPEGGLDAVMQVAVCKKSIGWRNVSRKLLLYISDDPFHSAGDGKLAGIVLPNDGQCHLDDQGHYTAANDMDYPSVGHIGKVIREQNINLIFAIDAREKDLYERFSEVVEGSTVAVLAKDATNIVSITRENYKKISSKVKLQSSNSEDLSITYRSKCRGSELKNTNQCDGLKIGEKVTFDIELEISECPSDPALRHRELVIAPVGLSDRLKIDLEIICECDCQKPDQAEANSVRCSNGNGTYACGTCTCNEGRHGRQCECAEHQLNQGAQENHCQPQNSSLVCSGRGECVCGECYCLPRTPNSLERFSGDFCECDDYSCDLYDGMLCGGPTRGRCRCGTCVCNPGYNGTSCDCPISTQTCLAPNGAICNGQGECVCGKCQCDKESRCYGDFCEHCPSCVGNCNCNKDCVNCRIFRKGIYSAEECENKCGDIDISEVEVLEENDNGTTCQEMFSDQTECTFKFNYEYGPDNKLKIRAQKIIVCPEPADMLPIILGVVGAVLVGIISLIIWKVCVTVYDHREYSRFKEEIDRTRWAAEQNPLYRDAIQTFENPICDNPSNGQAAR